ncbi:hypothetical protein BVI2075_160005 [Burkholderia vietnamiensis]|nr:hypothetical protein BVI2075_160005 [Burkholderia vietnamiensis]
MTRPERVHTILSLYICHHMHYRLSAV